MFSNLIAPPVIAKLGSKWSLVIAATTYVGYMAVFLHLETWLYYAASALNGVGAGVLWTANGVYLVEHSKKENLPTNTVIMWSVMQTSLLAGSKAAETGPIIENPEDPPMSVTPTSKTPSVCEAFTSTFKLIATKKMAVMLTPAFFLGVQAVVATGVFPPSIEATRSFESHQFILPYIVLAFGAGAIAAGALFRVMERKKKSTFGNRWVILVGTVLMMIGWGLCALIIPWKAAVGKTEDLPLMATSSALVLLIGFLFGVADSCWQAQMMTMVGGVWRESNTAPAYALLKFFQAGAACFGYFCGKLFELHIILAFVAVLAIISTFCFFTVQRWAFKEQTQVPGDENGHAN
ncbi:unnamed protein product, partial [Mesorhabditis spiculigera]